MSIWTNFYDLQVDVEGGIMGYKFSEKSIKLFSKEAVPKQPEDES